MSAAPDLRSLLLAEENLYALLEPAQPLRASWGHVHTTGRELLHFRKFHFPRAKPPSVWGDFPESATWTFSQSREFPRPPPLAPLARPKEAAQENKNAWLRLCGEVAASIHEGAHRKLVPARQISFALSREEYHALLSGLAQRLFAPEIENAFRFVVKSGGSVFFGVTPELLFRRENGHLFVPAIAGTRALLPGLGEASAGEELLASAKDRAEHTLVVEGIRAALAGLGLDPSSPPAPSILRVPRLLHLFTPVSALSDPRVSGETLLEALHPTPAIGGFPQRSAAEFLHQHENWDRGLFSAPLLFRAGERELCLVAIRSALLTPERLYFFAGAGYVEGSTAEAEWTETKRKLQVMQTILFGDTHGTE